MAIAISLGKLFRCLYPPAGTVALHGIISKANLNFVLSLVWFGSLVLVLWELFLIVICNKKQDIQFIGFNDVISNYQNI